MRVDVPDKVNGRAQYAIDVQLPGMLYGAVLRAPVEGAAPERIDDVGARAVAGVVKVIRLPYGVGVVAETPWAAFDARRALAAAVTWTKTAKAWGFDSDKGLADFAAAARDLNQPSTDWFKAGDLRTALSGAAATMDATYLSDYAYHAQMEPLNAVASVSASGDAAEIWTGTQSPTTAHEATAKALGISRDRVKLNTLLMGGGFGRRGPRDSDFTVDAVLLAKDAGRPVKVMWTREDDLQNGRFRPLSAHYLRAGLDVSGRLVAWHHRHVGDRVTPFFDPVRYEANKRRDGILMAGTELAGYDVPNQLVEQLYQDTGVRTAPLRGIGFIANKFATESFMDEIARQRSVDPLQFRTRHAAQEPACGEDRRACGADGGLGPGAQGSRARAGLYRLFRHAGCRHRGDIARSFERPDRRARLLVHDRLRHCGSARQCRGADREQYRLRPRRCVERADYDQGRRRAAVEFL